MSRIPGPSPDRRRHSASSTVSRRGAERTSPADGRGFGEDEARDRDLPLRRRAARDASEDDVRPGSRRRCERFQQRRACERGVFDRLPRHGSRPRSTRAERLGAIGERLVRENIARRYGRQVKLVRGLPDRARRAMAPVARGRAVSLLLNGAELLNVSKADPALRFSALQSNVVPGPVDIHASFDPSIGVVFSRSGTVRPRNSSTDACRGGTRIKASERRSRAR
jgi:hypothetical protein